jgi:hypothetical protein
MREKHLRKAFEIFVLKGIIFLIIFPIAALPAERGTAQACTEAAAQFLAGLNDGQLEQAQWPFAGDERRKWTYFPNVPQLDVRSEGLALKDMTASQRAAAHNLVACGLSSQGYQKAAGIVRLDDILGQTDLYRPRTPTEEAPVGAEKYWLAVFGKPSLAEPWGWQFEGHHLALNFTVVDDVINYAPAFMGADPARVPDGRYAGWRLLADEVDLAVELVNSLTGEQADEAILTRELPERMFTAPGREDALKEFAGITAAQLSAEQQALLLALIDAYVGNAADPIARMHRAEIMQHWPNKTWFGWMGPTAAEQGIYYRIHNPALLIEFVTARDRQSEAREPNPNHVHSMFIYPGNNYGDDWLRRHFATSPEHQHD